MMLLPLSLQQGRGVAVFIRAGVGAPGVMLIGHPFFFAGRFLSQVSRLFRSLARRHPSRHPALTRACAAKAANRPWSIFSRTQVHCIQPCFASSAKPAARELSDCRTARLFVKVPIYTRIRDDKLDP